MMVDPSGQLAISALIVGAIIGACIGFGICAYIDYQDEKMFNGDVKWYDYLVATVVGGLAGAAVVAFVGTSFSFSIPTLGIVSSGGTAAIGVSGSVAITITGAQVLEAAGIAGMTYIFASDNRPKNNRNQNEQYKSILKKYGYSKTNPEWREFMNTQIIDGMKKEGKAFRNIMIVAIVLFLLEFVFMYIDKTKLYDVLYRFLIYLIVAIIGLYGWLYSIKYKVSIDKEQILLNTLFKKVKINICDIEKYTYKRYNRKSVFYQFNLFIKGYKEEIY